MQSFDERYDNINKFIQYNYVNLWNPEFSCIVAGSESSTS